MPGTVALAVTAAAVLGACSRGEVSVQPAPLAAEAACATAREDFPDAVAGAVEQPVSQEARDAAAAWGNPPIVARCGLMPPAPTQDPCVTVGGVDWVVQDLDDGVALVTYGRTPALEVLVPANYPQSADLVAPFAQAAGALQETGRHCS